MKNSTYSEYVSNLHVKCAYLFLYETAEIPREEKREKKAIN